MCENKQETIDNCFKTLSLDNRASKREVEIAYDVLSKCHTENIIEYRNAFEYLMYEVFKANEKTNVRQEIEKEYYNSDIVEKDGEDNAIISLDDKINIIKNIVPTQISQAVAFTEHFTAEEFSDYAKSFWEMQVVNLPMLTQSIIKNVKSIFGFKFMTHNGIKNILSGCCFNTKVYRCLTFELTYNTSVYDFVLKDLRDMVEGLKSMYYDNILCTKFQTHNTAFGVMGQIIAETSVIDTIYDILVTKVTQNDDKLYLNASTTFES